MKTPKQTTEEKYLNFFNYLYERKRSFNVNKVLSKFKIGIPVGTVLKKFGMIVNIDGDGYKWDVSKPDIKIVKDVISEINTTAKLTRDNKTTEPKVTEKISQSTEEKYLSFLNYLYERQRGWSNMKNVIKKHKLSDTFGMMLGRLNLVKKEDGIWNFIGNKPNMEMAQRILARVNNYITLHNKSAGNKTSKKENEASELNLEKIEDKNFHKKEKKHSLKNDFIWTLAGEQGKGKTKHTLNIAKEWAKKHGKDFSVYIPKGKTYYPDAKEKNIIDISSLKSKRQELQDQIGKIDSFLEVAQDFLK